MFRPQNLESAQEARFTAVLSCQIVQIDEQDDGAVVARGLFRRNQAIDLYPYSRLSPCEIVEIFRACRCRLLLAPCLLDRGSRCRDAPPFIAGIPCSAQQGADSPRRARLGDVPITDQARKLGGESRFFGGDESFQVVIPLGHSTVRQSTSESLRE